MENLTVFNNEKFGDIRTVQKDGEPWFVLKDICAAFGEQNYRRVASRLDEEEKGVSRIDTLGGAQDMTVVNESGVYSTLFLMQPNNARNVTDEYIAERNEKLKAFKRWVTHDVLPTIRRTGSYQAKPMTQMEIVAANAQALVDHERRMIALEESQKAIGEKLDKAADAFTAPSFAVESWRDDARTTIAAIVQECGLSYQKYTGELYKRLENIAGVDLTERQNRRRNRMKQEGATYRERQDVTKLSVIAADAKLRAIFDGILREEKVSRMLKGALTA